MSHLACTILILCLGLPGTSARAETQAQPAETEVSKFSVEGEVLIYDSEVDVENDEISTPDVNGLLRALRTNEDVTTLRLTSGGGSVWAAKEMARIVIDFELDTLVDGECSSSCVRIFLAGTGRAMNRGSKIGFHSRHWSPDSIQKYYEKWREDEGWETPFEFASWVYRDTYSEAYEDITWSIARGVQADFAVEIHAPRNVMWFPTRAELRAGGVLRD